ncbi:MAG: hypothetical protein QG657_5542, partial [Acidobacteriota bacterium]|nr:hypothetical protein [Acidobacteriota bacterium]
MSMTKLKRTSNKNIADILALTPLQEGLLFHYLKDPGSDYYFEQLRLRISGPLDTGVFERAWNSVVETNEMLRTVFRWEKLDNPVQMVLKKHAPQWRYRDLSRPDARETEKLLEQIAANDREEKFDLREVPFRITLCELGESIFEVIISNHHILYDGWSNGIILKEFFNAYHDIALGKEPIKAVKAGFKEFIAWLGNRDTEKEREYWRNYLGGLTVGTGIPVKKRKSQTAQEIETYCLEFSREMKEGLAMVQKRRVSAAALLYSAWGILLQGYCNSEDVVFGTTVAGRSAKVTGIEDIVGLFINTLPLRVQAREGEKIEDLLYRINHTLQRREEVENTPLVEIDKCREPGSKDELFDSIVVIENYPLDYRLTRGMGALSLQSYSLVESAHYDLTVIINLFADIEITFSYDRGIFAREVVGRLAGHFQRIVQEMVELAANPGRETRQIEMLSPEEKRQLVEEFNNTAADFPRDETIHRLFEEQASKTPDHIVVVGADPVETLRATSLQTVYRQLNEQSDRLAGLLIEKGVLADDVVAIMIERSLEMVIGILGILKAGGAYMPIDPDYPQERIDYMLKDSGTAILLTDNEKEIIVNCQLLIVNCKLKTPPQAPFHHSSFITHHSNQLAYIIYTSGTTGRPKGVMVEHRNVVRLVKNSDYVEFREGDRILQTGALEFDASTFEIWGALLNGLMLFLVKKEQVLSPVELRKTVETYDISTMWLTSSLFNRLLEADIEIFAPLRNLLVGGEALSPVHINKLRARFARLNIINGYGPTENTTFSTTYRVDKEYNDNIPIGRPIANSTAYIVDRWNRIQPVCVVGELYVGGHGVARGYLNNPELTNQKFLEFQEPFFKKVLGPRRVYKTGDLCRWLPDGPPAGGATKGVIEFLGRIDSQVKIRGFRIEPGEIEGYLLNHKDIKEAVVIDHVVNNEKCLCAYIIVQEEKKLDVTELRQYLAQIMPAYMIPSYFIVMERLPLTANGKIDRKALPEPQVKPSEHYTAYRDEIEESLVEIWSHNLGIEKEKIGIDDNFFQLGGHSLKAMQLIGRVHKYFDVNIPITAIFTVPTIRGQANYIKSQRIAAAVGGFEALEAVEEKEYYELSPGQQRIYMIQQMDPRSTAFHISSAIELIDEANPDKIREIFKRMIHRHESLRTFFIQVEGKPVQRILEPGAVEFEIEYNDLAVEAEDIYHFIRPFDLSRAPLLRVGVIKSDNGKVVLLIDMHHIIADGVSVDILTAEFQALQVGRELPFPLIQYKDFCQWQSRLLRWEAMKGHEEYWLQRLEGQLPLLQMPTDYPRLEGQNLDGDYANYDLEKELSGKVRQYLRETGVTLYMLLLTVFNVLLYKYTGQEDIIIGSPIAGRDHADLEKVVGLLTGTLPMRNFPLEYKTFSRFLEEIKNSTLEAYEHRWYPFEEILQRVNYTKHIGRTPIFDILLIVQNTNTGNRVQRLSRSKSHEAFFPKTSKVDMTMIVEEEGDSIFLSLEYRTSLFKRESMERILQHFVHLLESSIADPTVYISQIEMTGFEERRQILEDFNDTESLSPFPSGLTLHELFSFQAGKVSGRVAVVGAETNHHVSYRQVDEQAGNLVFLLHERGVVPGDIVAVMMEPSEERIIVLLGILKAGAAYLPIDPQCPEERVEYMLKDCRAKIVVNEKFFRGARGAVLQKSPPVIANLAYIIYTSGSTGRPKGVAAAHQNVIAYLTAFDKEFQLKETDTVIQQASYTFDAFVEEMYPVLLKGGKLVVPSREIVKDTHLLVEFIARYSVAMITCSPLLLDQLNRLDSHESLRSIHTFISGGDVLHSRFIDKLLKVGKVYNTYGPTESTVCVTYYRCPEGIEGNVPIGKPVANYKAYILDRNRRLVPPGIPGELCVAGPGVAMGYLNRPELTRGSFEKPPLDPVKLLFNYHLPLTTHHSPLYHTGDLCKWLSDGNIEFLGRIDQQVKIRGFRIESGEIEARLMENPGIESAVVIAREDKGGDRNLIAYIVPRVDISVSAGMMREYLARVLPDYMLPSHFVFLAQIPLTPSGKVDRRALPEPGTKEEPDNYTAPRNEIEKKMAAIWSDVLLIPRIGIDDNFFQSGGHSLKATVMTAQVLKVLNIKVPLAEIFRRPTIRELGRYIQAEEKSHYAEVTAAEEKEYYPLSPGQKRLYLVYRMDVENTGYNITTALELEGDIHIEKLQATSRELIRRHESFRTSFFLTAEEAVQRIHPPAEVEFEIQILGGRGQGLGVRPFDLSSERLLGVGLDRIAD